MKKTKDKASRSADPQSGGADLSQSGKSSEQNQRAEAGGSDQANKDEILIRGGGATQHVAEMLEEAAQLRLQSPSRSPSRSP